MAKSNPRNRLGEIGDNVKSFNGPFVCRYINYETISVISVFKMVVGAFPLFKLVSLAVKQVSKPVASSLKTAAKQSEFFRKYVCIWPGQGKLILTFEVSTFR